MKRSVRGFTLIEIMIVIAIIGVLVAIAVPNFRGSRARSMQRACYANLKTIAAAVELYNLDYNASLTVIDQTYLQLFKEKGYLQSIPDDPGGGVGSSSRYKMDAPTGIVYCDSHGAIQANAMS